MILIRLPVIEACPAVRFKEKIRMAASLLSARALIVFASLHSIR
jgi:hypothetical protein